MTNAVTSLRRKIASAGDLRSIVRTMKAVAASSIGQYEHAALALADYYRTVELGLVVCFRHSGPTESLPQHNRQADAFSIGAVVFGSDQGLVGRFNDVITDYAIKTLADLPGKPQVWAVGERVHERLTDAGIPVLGLFPVPSSVNAITPLIGRILLESATLHDPAEVSELYLFYNRPKSRTSFTQVSQRMLPLDAVWRRELAERVWPSKKLPEITGDGTTALRAFIREYLFVSLFRACAESLASENASRLAAMQRADRNIGDLLDAFNGNYHRIRQGGIDEELFDVISGFEALKEPQSSCGRDMPNQNRVL
jgi:F-type H+-transporting ATPase subunit gamma